MSGTNVIPVNSVTTNSDFGAVSQADKSAEIKVVLPGANRQETAIAGSDLPQEKPAQSEPSREAVAEAVKSIAESIDGMSRTLEFSVNEPSGKVVVTVFDKSSEEIIRQIPGERAIAIAEHIASLSDHEPVMGLLLDSQA